MQFHQADVILVFGVLDLRKSGEGDTDALVRMTQAAHATRSSTDIRTP